MTLRELKETSATMLDGDIETSWNGWSDEKNIYFTSNDVRWIEEVLLMIKENPGTSEIYRKPEKNGGYLYCSIPKNWMRIKPPAKRKNKTDAEKEKKTEAKVKVE